MEETEAISRIKQGDLTGLEELVNRHQVKAVYTAYLILQDRSLAEEVAQDAFLKIVDKIHSFDESRPFSPWFFRIILNDAIEILRKDKRFMVIDEEPDEEAETLAKWLIDVQPLPEQQIEVKELNETLSQAIGLLNPEQRKAVVMRYYLQMSEREMSEEMSKPLTTVKWWLRSARNRLRLLIEAENRFDGQR